MMLRDVAILVGLTLSSVASAQTAEPSEAEKLTLSARNAARDGRCESLVIIGDRVRELDEAYHRDVFSVDPVIAACRQDQRTRTAMAPVATGSPAMTPPLDAAQLEDAPLPPGEYKSPGTALGLSLGITGGGVLLSVIAAGDSVDRGAQTALGLTGAAMIALGPTSGHIYAGNGWNTGLKWRLGSLGVATAAAAGALAACPPFSRCENEGLAAAMALVSVGAGVTYLGATLYEIGTAGRSARTYNETHQVSLGVAPVVGREPGLAVVGRF
jgi:hypothetical protein